MQSRLSESDSGTHTGVYGQPYTGILPRFEPQSYRNLITAYPSLAGVAVTKPPQLPFLPLPIPSYPFHPALSTFKSLR